MVVSYTVVFSVILAVMLIAIHSILRSNQRHQAALNHQLLVTQPLKQVERFLGEMDDIAYKTMTNQHLISQYAALREENDPENHFLLDVMDDVDTASVLAGLGRGMSSVWRLSTYNHLGDYLCNGATADKSRVSQSLQMRGPEGLMVAFATGKYDFLILAPETDFWSDYYTSEYISFLRPIMNPYSRDAVGVVEVQQNVSLLQSYIGEFVEADLIVNVFTDKGEPVVLNQNSSRYTIVASAVSEQYGWRVELLEANAVREKTEQDLFWLLFFVWVTLSLLILLVIFIISTRMAKPLTSLTKAVEGINIAEPRRLPPVSTNIGEINALQDAFNQVLESLTFSMDQEKKSFLMAMQAQMNPHFLYNVLSVINAVALENDTQMVVAICSNLSSMLRYSSSYEKGIATVAEEVAYTKEYLGLMKARYDYMFQYKLWVDPALAGVTIPKLVIQPICENAFTHPFANMEPPYKLDVRVQMEPNGWSIQVTDNGQGFAPNLKKEMIDRANNAKYEDLNKLQIGGLGLVSTVLRLKLLTRRRVECQIEDALPRGATVKILIFEEEARL